jgi:hypothetical protein
MEKLANCSTFSVYSNDNAKKFLSEFMSYALLHDLHSFKAKNESLNTLLIFSSSTWYKKVDSVVSWLWEVSLKEILIIRNCVGVNSHIHKQFIRDKQTGAFYSQILTHTKLNLLNMYDDHHGTK